MPPRSRRSSGTRGFSLLEAVIVIAIMAILATAMTPLLMRSLAQQRTQKTRDMVRSAYEALVGARDRSVPNLAMDVGFVPPAAPLTLGDLRFMTTINPTAQYRNGAIPLLFPAGSASFKWGWNGPYWTGPIQSQVGTNGVPVDAWGRPLRWANNQVQSAGADGQFGLVNGVLDDVVYPPVSTPPLSQPQLTVTVTRTLPPPVDTTPVPVSVSVTYVSQQAPQSSVLFGTTTFKGDGNYQVGPKPLPPGLVLIEVKNGADLQSQTITLALGETNRVVSFRTNL